MKRAPVSASVPSITTMYTVTPRTSAFMSVGSLRSVSAHSWRMPSNSSRYSSFITLRWLSTFSDSVSAVTPKTSR